MASQASLLDADQQRWTELGDMPNDVRRRQVWTRTDCKPFEHPLFNVQAQWGPQFVSHSIRVDPAFRSAWFSALGRRRFWYPFVLIVLVLSVVWLFQTWISGWTGAAIQCALLFAWMPIVLVECTQMDRYLLGLVLRSFDFWYLFVNCSTGQVFFFLRRSESFPPDAVLNAVTLNLGFWFVSALTFGMDALPQVNPRYKAIWMAVYMGTKLALFIQVRGDEELDVPVCFIFCTTARSFINSTQITQLAFAAKYLFYLIREPGRLMIVRPHANLSLRAEDPTEVSQASERSALDDAKV